MNHPLNNNENDDHNDPPVYRVELVLKHACLHSTTRWFQVGMFVIFLICLVCSVTSSYENLSAGLVWGGALSFFSVCFVIISYITEPTYQRHPNPLIFWRTIADAIFISRLLLEQFTRCIFYDCKPLCNDDNFQCGCSPEDSASEVCILYAGVLQFSLFAAECWFICMSINLYFSLTNPFTDFKRNMKMFHIMSWGSALFMALLLINIDGHSLVGYSYLGFCWTNALHNIPSVDIDTCSAAVNDIGNILAQSDSLLVANLSSWLFFYVWMALFLIISIGVWIWASTRLSEGMSETYTIRVQSINRARFYVFAVTSYWMTVMVVYILYLSTDAATKRNPFYEFMNFLLACRGYIDLVVWFALNDFRMPRWKHLRYHTALQEDVDVDSSPQVNAALRKEVLFYTTSGIIQAVQESSKLDISQRVQHLGLLPRIEEEQEVDVRKERKKTFHDYEPHAFRRIRSCFGVTDALYLKSLSTTCRERLSEGASGAFMFFSGDGGLIVKSCSVEEVTFLRTIAQRYADYLCRNPESLLTRFYGCHCLELYSNKFSFVVMSNLFHTEQVIHSRYDIKGSWVNRNVELPQVGNKVTCRHCNRKYAFGYDFSCTVRLGGHEPNSVLKDNDLVEKLRLDPDVALSLYEQLYSDTALMLDFGIMDYSLLLGVHDVEYLVDGEETNNSTTPTDTCATNKNSDGINPFASSSVLDCDALRYKQEEREAQYAQQLYDMHHRRSSAASSCSRRRLPRDGLRLANTVVGPGYYHLGLIDILQTWTFRKKAERFMKIHLKRVDGNGLSAIDPITYRTRFLSKMVDIFGLDVDMMIDRGDVDSELFWQQTTRMDLAPETGTTSVVLLRSMMSTSHLITPSTRLSGTSSSARPSTSSILSSPCHSLSFNKI